VPNCKLGLDEGDSYLNQIAMHPLSEVKAASMQASLLIEVEGKTVIAIEQAYSMVQIAKNLDRNKTYSIRVTLVGFSCGDEEWARDVLQFEGLWLDRPRPQRNTTESGRVAPETEKLATLPARVNQQLLKQSPKPVIELVTAEVNQILACADFLDANEAMLVEQRVGQWHNILRSKTSADIAIVPTEDSGLVPGANSAHSGLTIKDLFFRFSPLATGYFNLAWSFGTDRPAVLVLQLGLAEFVGFFSEHEEPKKSVMQKFSREFAAACVDFVKTIRANAYPSDAATSPSLDNDRSYIYNSAPSTLPIFLVPSFSSRRQFVTKKLTLHKFISEALNRAAAELHADGDKSTFWIDTTGWLDPRKDFVSWQNNTDCHSSPPSVPLTPEANERIAQMLADHLCPYLKDAKDALNASNDAANKESDCPFDRYDNYLGSVYLPDGVDFDRKMLERKVNLIKQRFGMVSEGSILMGEMFEHNLE
jgi:hypothetical protein